MGFYHGLIGYHVMPSYTVFPFVLFALRSMLYIYDGRSLTAPPIAHAMVHPDPHAGNPPGCGAPQLSAARLGVHFVPISREDAALLAFRRVDFPEGTARALISRQPTGPLPAQPSRKPPT